jgi:hypothetical protein
MIVTSFSKTPDELRQEFIEWLLICAAQKENMGQLQITKRGRRDYEQQAMAFSEAADFWTSVKFEPAEIPAATTEKAVCHDIYESLTLFWGPHQCRFMRTLTRVGRTLGPVEIHTLCNREIETIEQIRRGQPDEAPGCARCQEVLRLQDH